jgi:hypothetical protein
MPTPRANFAISVYQNKIYCIGNGPTEVYDIVTDNWSTKKNIPLNGEDMQAHLVDEKIFVIISGFLYMYDPVTDSWTQKTSLPTSEDYYTGYSAVIDNQIIAINHGDANLRIYDPKTDMWSEEKTTKGYDGSFGVAVAVATSGRFAPQKIYVLSGGSSIFFHPTGFVMSYNPLSGTWEQVKKDPTPRAKVGVAVLDDVLYVIGGLQLVGTDGQKETTSVNEQYIPIDYQDTLPPVTSPTTTPTQSNSHTTSEPEQSTSLTTHIIVATVVLTVGIIGITYFFYSKKEKNRTTGDYPF